MRVIGYVRVSSQEQVQGYSLDAQRRAIRADAESRGHELVAEYADEGKSARHDSLEKRPGFRAAIAAVKAGQADAILVHKPDRIARNLMVLLTVLSDLGGGVIAIEGDFDYASPEGKLRAHILGSVAQWYSDNLSREVKKGKDERRRQGLWNGRLPFGIRKRPEDEEGKMPPVRDEEPVLCTIADRRTWSHWDCLLHIFELAATGASMPRIVEEVHAIGFPLGLGTVWEILHNRFYLGEIPVRTRSPGRTVTWLPGMHEPFIDLALFDRAARTREDNRRGSATIRRQAHTYALSGLCRCGRCGDVLHCRTDQHGAVRLFCHTRQKRHACDLPQVTAADIEAHLHWFLEVATPPPDKREWTVERVRAGRQDSRRETAAIDQQLRRLRDLYRWGDIGQAEYLSKREELERRRSMAEPIDLSQRALTRMRQYLADLRLAYKEASPRRQNQLLRTVVESIEVDAGRVQRVRIHPVLDGVMRSWHADAIGLSPTTA